MTRLPTPLAALTPALLLLAACGTPAPKPPATGAAAALVDPAAHHCQRSGGTVILRMDKGRRADLCRLPTGRTVSAAELLNAHNDL